MILLNVVRAACNVDVLITLCLFLCMANGVKAFSKRQCMFAACFYLFADFLELAVFVAFPFFVGTYL